MVGYMLQNHGLVPISVIAKVLQYANQTVQGLFIERISNYHLTFDLDESLRLSIYLRAKSLLVISYMMMIRVCTEN